MGNRRIAIGRCTPATENFSRETAQPPCPIGTDPASLIGRPRGPAEAAGIESIGQSHSIRITI